MVQTEIIYHPKYLEKGAIDDFRILLEKFRELYDQNGGFSQRLTSTWRHKSLAGCAPKL